MLVLQHKLVLHDMLVLQRMLELKHRLEHHDKQLEQHRHVQQQQMHRMSTTIKQNLKQIIIKSHKIMKHVNNPLLSIHLIKSHIVNSFKFNDCFCLAIVTKFDTQKYSIQNKIHFHRIQNKYFHWFHKTKFFFGFH